MDISDNDVLGSPDWHLHLTIFGSDSGTWRLDDDGTAAFSTNGQPDFTYSARAQASASDPCPEGNPEPVNGMWSVVTRWEEVATTIVRPVLTPWPSFTVTCVSPAPTDAPAPPAPPPPPSPTAAPRLCCEEIVVAADQGPCDGYFFPSVTNGAMGAYSRSEGSLGERTH